MNFFVIVPKLKGNQLLGETKYKLLWQGVEQKLSLKQLHMGFVNLCGLKSF
jgi:hypothetical protein